MRFYFLIFFLLLPSLLAINLYNGDIINTTQSNSSITFSINATADNITVYPNFVTLRGVLYYIEEEARECDLVNHSTENGNLDVIDFGCTGYVRTGGSVGGSSGGGISDVSIDEIDEEKEEKLLDKKINLRLILILFLIYVFIRFVTVDDEEE